MSDTSAFGFGPFVPGFDFLQNLARSASATQASGSALPGLSSWVAPTLSVEELDKRIQELKAVQFWLEQNGTALKATIQALEVQKMTLTTLQGMNVNMAELAKAFTAKVPEPAAPAPAATPAPAPTPSPAPQAPVPPEPAAQAEAPAGRKARTAQDQADPTKADPAQAGAQVDPMQWWGSLTQQFQNIAAAALQDVAAQALKAGAAADASGASPVPAAKRSASARPSAARTSAPAAGRPKPVTQKSATQKPAVRKPRSPRS